MTKLPFFSIVTISFNQRDYLEDSIKSVISQDFDDYEYIIQDPGSNDGSRELISSCKSHVFPLFVPDTGPADGLNKAFARSKGLYYLFLNSDDTLEPCALSNFYRWISNDNSKHDVFSGGCNIIDSSGRVLRRAYSDKMCLRRAAYGRSILIQPSTVFSSRAYSLVGGFNPRNKSNWDGELFIDLALAGCKFTRSACLFSNYRLHGNSITGSGRLRSDHSDYSNRMYEKILGRSAEERKKIFSLLYGVERKILNPLDTAERLLRGPIFSRNA